MKVSGEIVAMALNATAWHRSQVQGFLYDADDEPDKQWHVVRDLTKLRGEQVVWRELASRADYEDAHKSMLLAQERARAEILADRINTLMGT